MATALLSTWGASTPRTTNGDHHSAQLHFNPTAPAFIRPTPNRYQIGTMYMRGLAVEVDLKKAVAWFEKADAQDEIGAATQLAQLAFDGLSTPSYQRARELLKRGVRLGNEHASRSLAEVNKAIALVR